MLYITCTVLAALSLWNPSHIVSQTGSYAGVVSIGVGSTYENTTSEAILGHSPAILAGEDLYSLTLKNTWHIPIDTHLSTYAGTNLMVSLLDGDTFVELPSQYPDRYYPPNGIRAALVSGVSYKTGKGSVYIEASIMDYYLEVFGRHPQGYSPKDLLNYGIGWKIYIGESK